MHKEIRVQETAFDPLAELAPVYGAGPSIGGVVSFVGLMRDLNQGDQVAAMTLEHYPGMTEKALHEIVDQAAQRWRVDRVHLVHRVGEVRPQDPIVLVAVASAHRGEAFRACEYIIDYLKTRAPFWKREQTRDGRSRWVEARASDDDAAAAWIDDRDARSGED
ncbi:MAG: molybdopterin synthase catalytic subunit MoaE [Gammaproteobacteria bacterium]|nr:molybdopterin synthase catalytic subunit MoaE [Gammaproteobacteria bacterium]